MMQMLRRQIKQHSRTARSGAVATVLTAHDPRETRAGGYGTSCAQFVFYFFESQTKKLSSSVCMHPSRSAPLVPKTFDVWAHLAAMPTPFEHAWQRFGTSGAGAETNAG